MMLPHPLLDHLLARMRIKRDAGLARALGYEPCTISRIRNRSLPVGATFILSVHEETGMPIRDIKALIP